MYTAEILHEIFRTTPPVEWTSEYSALYTFNEYSYYVAWDTTLTKITHIEKVH